MVSRAPSENGAGPAEPAGPIDSVPARSEGVAGSPADERVARRRNFLRLLFSNLLITVATCLPLYFFTSLPITLGFLGLMLLMSFTLAGYFALLRV